MEARRGSAVRRRWGRVWAVCAAGCCCAAAWGQGAAGAEPVSPLRSRPEPDRPRLVREGAFLVNMRCRLRRTEVGRMVDFAPDLQGGRTPSMALLPCMTLAALEQVAGPRAGDSDFLVSGQVFVFRGRNYLLLSRFEVAQGAPARPEQPATAGAGAEGDAPPGSPAEDPSVESLVRAVEERTGEGREPPAGAGPGSAPGPTLREGAVLALRRGRVMGVKGGAVEFTTDNDPESPVGDARLTLLPSLNLERLETLLADRPGGLVVSMSGRVFVHGQTNYLMPTMYVVEIDRTGDLTSGQ